MANYSTRHLYLNHNNVSECHNETYNGIRQSLANLDTRTNEDEVIVGLSVLTILMIMSFFGNVITLVVVRQSRRIQSTTNIFVVSLALSDLGLATVCAPFVAADVKFGPGWPSGEFTCKTTRFFQHVTPASSLLILASISLDRYYSILFPMCLKVTREKAKQIIFGLWIIVLSVCIPCFKFYTVEVVTFPFQQRAVSTHYDELFSQDVARPMSSSDNTTLGQVPQCKILPEHISSTSYLLCPNFVPMKNIGRLIYCLSLLVAFFLIPIFLTTVLFGLLIKHLSTLSQSRRFRGCNMKNMPTNIISIRKVKMLKTLVIMTSISIFLTIPFHINLLIHSFTENVNQVTDYVVFTSLVAAGASKPIVYFCSNKNFRQGCNEMFCMSVKRDYRSSPYVITTPTIVGKKNHVGVMSHAMPSNSTNGGSNYIQFYELQ